MKNLDDVLRDCELVADEGKKRSINVGLVLQMMAEHPRNGAIPLPLAVSTVTAAIEKGQLHVYFDRNGMCVGYVCWAFLDNETQQRMLSDARFKPAVDKWNSGPNTWIMDFFIVKGHLPSVIDHLCSTVFVSAETLTYFRLKNGKKVAKRIERCTPHALFRRSRSEA